MMMNLRSLTAASVAIMVLAACDSSSTSSSTGSTTTSSSTSSSPAAGAPAATPSVPGPAGTAVVTTATATVAGKSETILTDTAGKSLYYRTPDTATTAGCTGGCASVWPPLMAPTGTPTSATSVPGKLTVITSGNGAQVTYNGHPLYRFGSTPPGDTSGEGAAGIWHVATPGLT